jgi:hypothetical protein
LDFLDRAFNTHGNKYDYSEANYINSQEKLWITHKKCGYKFLQTPAHHVSGVGCPQCHSSKGELNICKYLDDKNIKYDIQKKFKECKDVIVLRFDVYIPSYNICIEYHGSQIIYLIIFLVENLHLLGQ